MVGDESRRKVHAQVERAVAGDPVGGGLVRSLDRPGGNVTGLSNLAEGLSAKWLELLKEAAPNLTRVAVLRVPDAPVDPSVKRRIGLRPLAAF